MRRGFYLPALATLSGVFATNDGCSHWKEEAGNSEKDGFWDALVFQSRDFGSRGAEKTGVLIGDPVNGRFETYIMAARQAWSKDASSCASREGESGFAASNSMVFVFGSQRFITVTGGKGGPRAIVRPCWPATQQEEMPRGACSIGGRQRFVRSLSQWRFVTWSMASWLVATTKNLTRPAVRWRGRLTAGATGRQPARCLMVIAQRWRGIRKLKCGSQSERTDPISLATTAPPGKLWITANGTPSLRRLRLVPEDE